MFDQLSSNNKQIEARKTRFQVSTSCKRNFAPIETADRLKSRPRSLLGLSSSVVRASDLEPQGREFEPHLKPDCWHLISLSLRSDCGTELSIKLVTKKRKEKKTMNNEWQWKWLVWRIKISVPWNGLWEVVWQKASEVEREEVCSQTYCCSPAFYTHCLDVISRYTHAILTPCSRQHQTHQSPFAVRAIPRLKRAHARFPKLISKMSSVPANADPVRSARMPSSAKKLVSNTMQVGGQRCVSRWVNLHSGISD